MVIKSKIDEHIQSLVQEPYLEWEFINGSIVKAHQHSAGAASEENQAIGKSRGSNTTKIHMAVDAHGLPIGSRQVKCQQTLVSIIKLF